MTIKYNDPYGKREYAQLKGEKKDSFFKVTFDEATLHKADDSYILYGFITEYQGVVRSFKPENPILPGICAIPFYGQEYEVRRKDKDGNWSSEKEQPSKFEAAIYRHLEANDAVLVGHDRTFSGYISHLPNAMCEGMTETAIAPLVVQNLQLNKISGTGKVPAFTPSVGGGQRKSYGGYKNVSPEDKVAFIISQLTEDVKHVDWKSGKTLAELTDQIIREHVDNENFISIYFDMVIACVR